MLSWIIFFLFNILKTPLPHPLTTSLQFPSASSATTLKPAALNHRQQRCASAIRTGLVPEDGGAMKWFTQETVSCSTEACDHLSLQRKQPCWGWGVGRRSPLAPSHSVFVNVRRRTEISGPWHISCLLPDAICSLTTHFLQSKGRVVCECPACLCLCEDADSLTKTTAVAWHCHEGAQRAADDTVRPPEGGLLEGTSVLVQEGVHTVGCGRAAVPHKWF